MYEPMINIREFITSVEGKNITPDRLQAELQRKFPSFQFQLLPAVTSAQSRVLINQIPQRFFASNQDQVKVATWQVRNQSIDLYFSKGKLFAEVINAESKKIIPGHDIVGLPKEILSNPEYLSLALEDTWVRLSEMSNGDYKLYISPRLRGGLSNGEKVLIGVCIVGGILLIVYAAPLIVAAIESASAASAAVGGAMEAGATVASVASRAGAVTGAAAKTVAAAAAACSTPTGAALAATKVAAVATAKAAVTAGAGAALMVGVPVGVVVNGRNQQANAVKVENINNEHVRDGDVREAAHEQQLVGVRNQLVDERQQNAQLQEQRQQDQDAREANHTRIVDLEQENRRLREQAQRSAGPPKPSEEKSPTSPKPPTKGIVEDASDDEDVPRPLHSRR